jgi:hypothetical protein
MSRDSFTNDTDSGTGEESNDDCVHDKIHAFLKASNQSALVVWVRFPVFL